MTIFLPKVVIISKNLCNFALRKRTDGKNEAYYNDNIRENMLFTIFTHNASPNKASQIFYTTLRCSLFTNSSYSCFKIENTILPS